MGDLFNDENGYSLLTLLKSLGEEINKACETEKLLSGKSCDDDTQNKLDVCRIIQTASATRKDTYFSPKRPTSDKRHYEDDEQVSPALEEDLHMSRDSINPPPPLYSPGKSEGDDDGQQGDYNSDGEGVDEGVDLREESFMEKDIAEAAAGEEDEYSQEGLALGAEDERDYADGDVEQDEWADDDDPGYIQIMITEQEFFDLEEDAAARLAMYLKIREGGVGPEGADDEESIDPEDVNLLLADSSGAEYMPRQGKLSLDLCAEEPVVEEVDDNVYADGYDDGDHDDEEEIPLESDLQALEETGGGDEGIQINLSLKESGASRGFNSRLSVDDDDSDGAEEEEEEGDAAEVNTEADERAMDDCDVLADLARGCAVGAGARESDLTTSATSHHKASMSISSSHMMGSLFSTGGGNRRGSEIMGQRKIHGVDGEHRYFDLKIIFEPYKTGFEEEKNFQPELGQVIAGRYRVVELLGTAAFSNAWQCIDTNAENEEGEWVCLKIIKNSKDFFDQSLDEIKLLQYINSKGDPHKYNVLKMVDYFYCKEHLFIVSELLRENLYEFGKYIRESGEEEYFTMPRLKKIIKQVLEALQYIHSLNLIHCDIKPENIVIKSYSRCEVKLIDFGSSCFVTDHLTSYIQSRSYRAPEVVLGLEYGTGIDIWSLGGVLAELYTGYVLFQNDSLATMLARIEGIMGPFPPYMLEEGREANRYYTSAGVVYERTENPDGSFAYSLVYPRRTNLRRRLHITSPPGPPGEPTEDDLFVDMVCSMLSLDPRSRPEAGQALLHSWLDDVDSLDVTYCNES